MGPVRPDGFLRHRCHRSDFEGATTETEKVLHVVQRNLVRMTHQVPMIALENLLKEMQRRVGGVPWDWVWLFRHVANVVVYFLAAHPKLVG